MLLDHPGKAFLNLATGDFVPPPDWVQLDTDPEHQNNRLAAWLDKTKEVDVTATLTPNRRDILVTLCNVGLRSDSRPEAWDEPDLLDNDVFSFLHAATDQAWRVSFWAKEGQSTLHAFRTRNGAVGLLQAIGISDYPRGVKLRYKLVQNGVTTSAPVNQPPPAVPKLTFGPVVERDMEFDETGQTLLLDPDFGTIHPPTTDNLRSLQGLRIRRDKSKDSVELIGYNHLVVQASLAGEWNEIRDWQAVDTLRAKPALLSSKVWQGYVGKVPPTFLFRTASGQIGLLQITGFTENPRGVKLCYKLVQQKTAAANQQPTN